MKIDVSLEKEPRGYACLCADGETLIIFLDSVTELLPYLGSKYLPFQKFEDLIEEWVIHEIIHKITEIQDDKIIDGWHIVLCHLFNPKMKECKCPIDCFWRDVYN